MKKIAFIGIGLGAVTLGGLALVSHVAAKAPALPAPKPKPKVKPKPAAAKVVKPSEIPSHAVVLKHPTAAAPLKHYAPAPAAAAPAAASHAASVPAASHAAAPAAAAPVVFPDATPMTHEDPPAPTPDPLFTPRTSKRAAQDLYDYVTARIRAGAGDQLGTDANRNEIVLKAQQDMKGAKLLAALAKGQGGVYGPLTRARGKELLGREFPSATKGH